MRLRGHSVVICKCRAANGFLPCPAAAIGTLTPTYPPEAYRRAAEALALEAGKPTAAPILRVYSSGYTGSLCPECGGARMRRSGTCETCDDCGYAGGCG